MIGNPNTGKSTLFTALAGVRQRVGNYPGVTVEKKIGHTHIEGQHFTLVDLPGTYSLAPRSPDEMVAVDVLLGRQADLPPPDAVLCIVDASNIERNLYLVSQVLEFGLPTVVALNMTDVAKDRGMAVDLRMLQKRLCVPVVEIQANRRIGIAELKKVIHQTVSAPVGDRDSSFPAAFRDEVAQLQTIIAGESQVAGHKPWPRYLVERLLLDTSGYLQQSGVPGVNGQLSQWLEGARARLAAAGCPVPAVEAMARYGWVAEVLEGAVTRRASSGATSSDRIDRVLTHKAWGTLIFAAMMLLVFSSIFIFAQYPMEWIDGLIGSLGDWVKGLFAETKLAGGALESLLVDGVVGGVGAVVIFLPQIMILFGFIAVLEDCGYMARAAYLMDKLMVRAGLSGKSFIPLLSSFACAVPGIMATRVIENRRDRLTTILVAPLMSCSARLPVYVILIAAFIPKDTSLGWLLPGLVMFSMYLLGIVTAVLVALVLKRTLLRGTTPPFVMELPSYKWPSASMVAHRMVDRGWAFLQRAGTLIFAVTIVIWALLYYPQNPEQVEQEVAGEKQRLEQRLASMAANDPGRPAVAEQLATYESEEELANMEAAAHQRQSILGRMGQFIEPIVRPLGWDWRIGCAAIASFPAREVVMGVLGVIYNMGEGVDVGDEGTQELLGGKLRAATWDGSNIPVFNVPVALSLMVFFALCAQCAATLAVIRRETNSWRWPLFTFVYMTVLSYVGALATYQIGMAWLA